MVLLAVACGLAGAAGAVVFRILIRFCQALFFGGSDGLARFWDAGLLAEAEDPLEAAQQLAWPLLIGIPALGGLLVGPIIDRFAREAKGHGVPEVMAAVALRGGVIRHRVAAAKTVASAISIGSGGSVGREGPIVQIGAAIGSAIGQLVGVNASRLRTLVACGGAAGMAATFNAPIAGALFAAEVILADFAVAQLGPIVISSVVATVASRYLLGDHPAFPVPTYALVSPFELVPYMAAGAIAGVIGLAFMFTLARSEDFFESLRMPGWLKPAIGGALVGVIGIWLPNVFGVGYATIAASLESQLPAVLLGVLIFAKIAATSLTLASGGSGGIFAPSLFLGAMTGGFVGSFIHQWFPASTAESGAYALVTMGALVAATTRAPITAIIILFEMTQSISIIPPLMAACVVSTLVSSYLYRESIYTANLRRRGIDLYEDSGPNLLKDRYVHEIVDPHPAKLRDSAGFQEVLDQVLGSERNDFFVVDGDDRLVGWIHLRDFTRSLVEQDVLEGVVVAGDLAEPAPPSVTPQSGLHVVMQIFSGTHADEIAVVNESDAQRMVGSVRKADVIAAYNEELLRRDLAGSVSSQVLVATRGQQVTLGGGYVLQEIQPPPRFFGRTLRALNLGAETGVHIVLLHKHAPSDGRPAVRVPDAGDVIEEGDRLVVSGTRSAVEGLDAF